MASSPNKFSKPLQKQSPFFYFLVLSIVVIPPFYYIFLRLYLSISNGVTSSHVITLSNHLFIWPAPLKYPSSRTNNVGEPKYQKYQVINNDYRDRSCDLFTGEWVPNPSGPQYTNDTCLVIHDHQNCMKYQKPDLGFTKWKWKPAGRGCGHLPDFDPLEFLQTVRGKSMAFVGDSIVRNQVQSLICLLSKVEYPEDVSNNKDFNFPRWRYGTFNFTLVNFWSPYLVQTKQDKPTGAANDYGRINVYLDKPDKAWTTEIHKFDFVVISSGHWFIRPLNYHQRGSAIGCTYFCNEKDGRNLTTVYPPSYGYRFAFRAAYKAILGTQKKGFNGTVFLRTFAPSHFEGGEWDDGADCPRKKPWKAKHVSLEGNDKDFYVTQVEEFNLASEEGRRRGIRFKLIDITRSMLLRPDGHPSNYGHPPREDGTVQNDCVHWCLPGPIDYWNSFMFEMLKRS